jgi:hypothetical protein
MAVSWRGGDTMDLDFLVAVEASTGDVYWKTARDHAKARFEIVTGHAISSTRRAGRYALLVTELDTGRVVDRARRNMVPTASSSVRKVSPGACSRAKP